MRKTIVLTALLLVAACILAAVPALGDFGPLGTDCRVLGKGGAGAADAEGSAAVYWNPAGVRRGSGLSAVLGFGMLQHPDPGEKEYGVTDRPHLAASWAPEDEHDPFSFGIAIERPFPRFDYDGRSTVDVGPAGISSALDVSSSQDYMELLAATGLRVLRAKMDDLTFTLDVGLALGLGFCAGTVSASLDDYGTAWPAEFQDVSRLSLMLPGGLGLMASIEGRSLSAVLGIRYRGVLPLSDGEIVSFGQSGYAMTEADLFMPPPQEGGIGAAVTFFRQLTYSIEWAYLFFNAPDAFPNHVPHNYSVFKAGVEYRVPLVENRTELAMRLGFSRSSIPVDALQSVYTQESTGVYFGWGARLDPMARLDAYFTVQFPGEGDVDETYWLASVSYGVSF